MSLQKNEFIKQISRICVLTGHTNFKDDVIENILEIFYNELKDYDFKDFQKACKDDELLHELSRGRFNFISFKTFIEKHRNERLKLEEDKRKKKEMIEAREAFQNEGIPDEIKEKLRKILGRKI